MEKHILGEAVRLRIDEILSEKGMSLKEFSEASGISYSQLRGFRRAKDIRMKTLLHIIHELKITEAEFFKSELFLHENVINPARHNNSPIQSETKMKSNV